MAGLLSIKKPKRNASEKKEKYEKAVVSVFVYFGINGKLFYLYVLFKRI